VSLLIEARNLVTSAATALELRLRACLPEVGALFFGDGHLKLFHDLQHIFPDLAFGFGALISEDV
jgi:hypothetical protein